MTRISSRNLANQFIKNKKLTKSKRFYVYNLLGKRKCRVLDLTNINGEQKLVLVYYYTKDNKKKITNPKIPINDNPFLKKLKMLVMRMMKRLATKMKIQKNLVEIKNQERLKRIKKELIKKELIKKEPIKKEPIKNIKFLHIYAVCLCYIFVIYCLIKWLDIIL